MTMLVTGQLIGVVDGGVHFRGRGIAVNTEVLPRVDQVGILDLTLVGLVDQRPLVRIVIDIRLAGDLPQAVTLHDHIGISASGGTRNPPMLFCITLALGMILGDRILGLLLGLVRQLGCLGIIAFLEGLFGFLNDLAGIMILIPSTRLMFKRWLRKKFDAWSSQKRIDVTFYD